MVLGRKNLSLVSGTVHEGGALYIGVLSGAFRNRGNGSGTRGGGALAGGAALTSGSGPRGGVGLVGFGGRSATKSSAAATMWSIG